MKKAVAYLPPVTDATRPVWSVMIPSYNCAHLLSETLRSVLCQDPGEALMQIEVIDDHSTDDPEKVVRALGGDRVGFFRQPENVGHIRNFETALRRSKGHFIHLLHGDDRVLPGFYEQMGALLSRFPAAGAGFCRHYFIDADGDQCYLSPLWHKQSGIFDGFREIIHEKNIVQTPAIVVRREVYERLGMFDARLLWTEDWEMWARISRHYEVLWCKQPLAEYRIHQQSNTGRSIAAGLTVQDYNILFPEFQMHMADQTLSRKHKSVLAWHFLNAANEKQRSGDTATAKQILVRALKEPIPFSMKCRAARLLLKLNIRK